MEILASILACVFFPEITIALTAQTKENASELLEDKYNEIMRFYPLLKNEVIKANFAKGKAEIFFRSGAVLNNLANAQSSKGQRRKRINVEESALLNNELFDDALAPIVEVPRVCIGKYSVIDPEELNQQINFFTTAGFKGTDEYSRSITETSITLLGKITTTSSNLTIRSQPNTTSSSLGYYTKASIVQLTAKTSNGWYRTDRGYISGSYVSTVTGQVYNCGGLNFRTSPDPGATVIKTLKPADEMMLLKEENGWYNAKLNDGTIGWVSKKYIRIL